MCSRRVPEAASNPAGTSAVVLPRPLLAQHPRVVVLLQEDQGVGLGRGEPGGGVGTGPGLPVLGALGAANLPF